MSVENDLQSGFDQSPSVLDELCTEPQVWDVKLAKIFGRLPARFLNTWEIYDGEYETRPGSESIASSPGHETGSEMRSPPYHTATIAYSPPEIATTSWTSRTNYITISYTSYYRQLFDVDPTGTRYRPNQRSNYLIYGPMVDKLSRARKLFQRHRVTTPYVTARRPRYRAKLRWVSG